MRKILIALLLVVVLLPFTAHAEDKCWRLVDEQGQFLTTICYEPDVGDMYLSENNHSYTVTQVNGDTALLRDDGEAAMPDVSWLESIETAQVVSAVPTERRIAMYCTHSDESYEPTDGYYSSDERGSIYQVANLLGQELTGGGLHCEVSDMLHHPHDAGAYRRSRQTAMQLVKMLPDALFDIHRDGIPDPAEYTATIGGKQVSRIRLLVGRGNQNMEVNKDFALALKAVADQVYPKLVKDIYMGRGVFNQDLLPKALLLECGTYTLPREQVDASMPMLADVITRTLYGGRSASAGSGLAAAKKADPDDVTQGEPDLTPQPLPDEPRAAGNGMMWLVGLLGVGLVIFGVAQTGSARGGMHKASRHLSEMTGGLIGSKPEKDVQTTNDGKQQNKP